MVPIIVIFVAVAVVLFFLLKSKVAKVLVSAFVIVVGVVLMMQDSTINQKQEQNVVKSENKLEGENNESGQNNSDSKDSTQESNNDKSDEKKEDKEASNKDNSQSTQNNSNQSASLKSTYLQELASLEAKTNNMLDGYTTYEMTNSATQIYTLWDNELNKIYGVLKNQLSESEMNSLRQKQREWITYRDNKAEQDAAEYEGGTMAQLELILSKANTTQERCYELVNWYMK